MIIAYYRKMSLNDVQYDYPPDNHSTGQRLANIYCVIPFPDVKPGGPI